MPTPVEFTPVKMEWAAVLKGQQGDTPVYSERIAIALRPPENVFPNAISAEANAYQASLLAAVEANDFSRTARLAGEMATRAWRYADPETANAYELLVADAALRSTGHDPVGEKLIVAVLESQGSAEYALSHDASDLLGDQTSLLHALPIDETSWPALPEWSGPMVQKPGFIQVMNPDPNIFIGQTVRELDEDIIGEIDEFTVDAGGKIRFLTELDGYSGIGEKTVELPYEALTTLRRGNTDEFQFYIDEALPGLK